MRTRYIWSGLTRRFKSNNAAVLHWTAQHCLVSLAGEMWTSIIWYVQQVAVWHCWLACYPRISMLNVSRRVWGGGWLGRGGAHRQRPPGQRDQAGPDQARPGQGPTPPHIGGEQLAVRETTLWHCTGTGEVMFWRERLLIMIKTVMS